MLDFSLEENFISGFVYSYCSSFEHMIRRIRQQLRRLIQKNIWNMKMKNEVGNSSLTKVETHIHTYRHINTYGH